MKITSLEKMENIVENNGSLSWDGWTVVESKVDPNGWSNVKGSFINDQWHMQNRFEPTEQGWNIPNKFMR